MHILLRSLVLSISLLALTAAAAAGAVRYAGELGPGSAPCTSKSNPCTLTTALTNAIAGDDVELAPGDYYPASAVIIPTSVDVYGEAGKPRPFIRSVYGSGTAVSVASSASLSYVEATNSGVHAVVSNAGTVSRSRFIGLSTTTVNGACELGNNGKYLNSICVSMGKHAFYAFSQGAGAGAPVSVRNSVGVSFSGNADDCGLSIRHQDSYARTYNIVNSALEASAHGVCLDASGVSTITLNLVNSNFRSLTSVGPSGAVRTVNNTNSLQAEPAFTDIVGQDFHLAVGSPLINAGLNDPANGTADFDGNPRTIDGTTDIGAFESTPPPTLPPLAPTTTISKKLKAKSKSFTAAKSGAAFQVKSKQPKKKRGKPIVGTLISFTLSQADDVTFTLERASEGRKSGSKCVKKTTANKSKKKCQLFKKLSGTETATGLTAGSNTIWWTGRWNKKKLAPGSYSLRGTPIKASTGNEPGVLDPRPVKILLK